MTPLLLTGFSPFADLSRNPSQDIVNAIAAQQQPGLTTTILPVIYQEAGDRLLQLIAQLHPRAVICLGLGRNRQRISLERFALNLNDASIPDNAGDHAQGRPIVAEGPAAYQSSLPLDALRHRLLATGIPVEISNHAGTYVCNHVFYRLCHLIAQQGTVQMGGFIHLPPCDETGTQGLPFATMLHSVELCIAYCMESLTASDTP